VRDTGLDMSTPFNFQPTLAGNLLAMRPFTEADFETLYAVASDPDIWALHPFRERYQRPVFRKFIDDAIAVAAGWSRSKTRPGGSSATRAIRRARSGPTKSR
jgi:hypothetical protein